MAVITVTEKDVTQSGVAYISDSLTELLKGARCQSSLKKKGSRLVLEIDCPDDYEEIVKAETADKAAEVVAIKYKNEYIRPLICAAGLTSEEKDILMASLIAADFDEDKKFAFERFKTAQELAIDGVYNFRMKALKRKWTDIASYIPIGFLSSQLKDFIFYLLENKKRRVFVDGGKVYDSHFRRLNRSDLLGGENLKIIREILLSNCGEVELAGELPHGDEEYIKEFFKGRIIFSHGYFS